MKPSTRLPPLRALRTFQAAGQHLSFKLAADELFVTASAVSHQVKNLEEFLGLELFVRKTRALELTEAGRTYLDFLSEMFARLETETKQLRTEFGRGILRLCVPPFFANELLMPRLQEFQDRVPDTDIRLMVQPSLMKVHPPDADVSILLGAPGDWPDLETRPLFKRQILTACSPDFKKSAGIRTARDLDGKTLIVHENRPRSWVNWARAVKAKPPQAGTVLRFDSMAAVVQAAAQGLGVAIVSWPLSRRWFEAGDLVLALNDRVETDELFHIAWRDGEKRRPDVERLIEWIRQEFILDS